MRSIYYNDKLRGLGMGGGGRGGVQRTGTLYMCEGEYAVQMVVGTAAAATSDIKGK